MNQPNEQFINEFCNRLQRLLENSPLSALQQTGKDGAENIRAIGESLLAQMNVVSRREFDAQNAILAETAKKLAELEEKLAALEKNTDT